MNRITNKLRLVGGLMAACVAATSCTALGLASECGGTDVIASFEEVGDLVVASNVQSSDVVVGSVKEIELDGWEARVSLCIEEGRQISADVRAVVRTTSLLGEKFIDLQPRSPGPPFLEEGDRISVQDTRKATELEQIFAKLASILGSGNLEQLNKLTHSQATILRDHADDVRLVLRELRKFTDTLDERKGDIALAVDSLDAVARSAVDEAQVLEQFLSSFASSSGVLANQKEGLESLFETLDRFTKVAVQLLRQSRGGLEVQLRELRPILRTVVENSANLRESIVSLATFSEYFPESMPGDYLQLDVCQALPDMYQQGTSCPQSQPGGSVVGEAPTNPLDFILHQPLRSDD